MCSQQLSSPLSLLSAKLMIMALEEYGYQSRRGIRVPKKLRSFYSEERESHKQNTPAQKTMDNGRQRDDGQPGRRRLGVSERREEWGVKDLWSMFQKYGLLMDVYIAKKRAVVGRSKVHPSSRRNDGMDRVAVVRKIDGRLYVEAFKGLKKEDTSGKHRKDEAAEVIISSWEEDIARLPRCLIGDVTSKHLEHLEIRGLGRLQELKAFQLMYGEKTLWKVSQGLSGESWILMEYMKTVQINSARELIPTECIVEIKRKVKIEVDKRTVWVRVTEDPIRQMVVDTTKKNDSDDNNSSNSLVKKTKNELEYNFEDDECDSDYDSTFSVAAAEFGRAMVNDRKTINGEDKGACADEP
nr:hypothetical protein [Tanacetum cinerariifolium]